MAHRCHVCGVELIIGGTWTVSLQKGQRNICRECYNELRRQRYRERHPPKDIPYPKDISDPKCRVCGMVLTNENWYPSFQKAHQYVCKSCENKKTKQWQKANPERAKATNKQWRKANPERAKALWTRRNRKQGHRPMSENKECSTYLGIYVAERVLSHVFKNAQMMPTNNHGYDFICGRGYKIDVKSACKLKNQNRWVFHIRRNHIADYFLCLAFDNRDDLNPLHIWLIPGDVLNHLANPGISSSTIHKWDEYKLDITKVATCCNALR